MKVTKTVTGSEPVTLAEAKEYLRVFHDTEDNTIQLIIKDARKTIEQATGLSLVEQSITIKTDIDGVFTLPYGPVDEVILATIDGVDVDVEMGKVEGKGLLEVEYTSGPYESGLVVRELTAFLYENRGNAGLGYRVFPDMVDLFIRNNTNNLWLR